MVGIWEFPKIRGTFKQGYRDYIGIYRELISRDMCGCPSNRGCGIP